VRLFKHTDIDFLSIKWICISISIASILIGSISLVVKRGPNLGIDFTGGAQIVYGFAKTPDENEIRKVVETANVKVTSVQRFDKPEKNQILLRVPQEKHEGRDISREVTAALTKALFPQGEAAGTFDLAYDAGFYHYIRQIDLDRYLDARCHPAHGARRHESALARLRGRRPHRSRGR